MRSTPERCAPTESATAPAGQTSSSPATPPIGDLARFRNILAGLSAEDRALLEPRLLPAWELRRWRLTEPRDAALRELAAAHIGDGKSWPIARRLHRELAVYVDRGSWRFDRDRGPPADPRKAAMYRAVRLHGHGKAPSRTTIWRAFAGPPSRQPKDS